MYLQRFKKHCKSQILDFQSSALPTELPSQFIDSKELTKNRSIVTPFLILGFDTKELLCLNSFANKL